MFRNDEYESRVSRVVFDWLSSFALIRHCLKLGNYHCRTLNPGDIEFLLLEAKKTKHSIEETSEQRWDCYGYGHYGRNRPP